MVGGVVAYMRPWRELILVVGPGFEYEHGHAEALIRLGGMYEFEVGGIGIAPAVYLDAIQHEDPDLVFGVNFIWKY